MKASTILEGLNPAQREAVELAEGPLLILAGPGSGKTRVIAHRIAYLVAEVGVHPYRIVAVTFTNKAAREMRDRVVALLGESAHSLMLGTFHSVCARILRADGERIGIGRGFAIYDDADQQVLMRQAMADLDVDPHRFQPRAVLATISRAKSELASPAAYLQSVRDYFQEVVARCYERYQALLLENNALDFDDLIMRTVGLFRESDEVLRKYQERFLHVLIDEFQDTNVAQYVLARQLAGGHGNICVVGDPDQSIYAWRSADLRNILNFERDYPEARVVYLSQSYRSTRNILDSAHAVISLNRQRKEKELWTEKDAGPPIAVYEAYDEAEEADFVAAEAQALVSGGDRRHGDIAVMYRTNAQSRALEEAFLREAIPYRLVGGTRFYERREVKDIIAYLRLVHNPYDRVSVARVINVPARGIGQKTLAEMEAWAASLESPLYGAMQRVAEAVSREASAGDEAAPHPLAPRSAKAVAAFVALLEGLREGAGRLSLSSLVTSALERTAYRQYLLDHFDDGEERWENVQELLTVASEYDGLAPEAALLSFLEDVALVTDIDEYDEKADAVTLITLHQAKGLEFSVVFIVGLEEGLLPHIRSYDDPAQMEEERRLCYVGMTRAEERLYMVRAFRRHLMGMSAANPASRFLKDLPPDLVTRREAVQEEVEAVLRGPGRLRRQPAVPSEAAYAAGERVRHPRFGEGIVVSCTVKPSDQEVVVAFQGEAGIKKLLLSFAPLERIHT
ncbi:MAG: UvrD-helicase domain-containing protein [Dehalococcoidia bacterium]